jgi:hypothetical protein
MIEAQHESKYPFWMFEIHNDAQIQGDVGAIITTLYYQLEV